MCANYKVLKIAHKRQSGWQKKTAAAATEHWPLDNEDEAKQKKAHRDLCHKKGEETKKEGETLLIGVSSASVSSRRSLRN